MKRRLLAAATAPILRPTTAPGTSHLGASDATNLEFAWLLELQLPLVRCDRLDERHGVGCTVAVRVHNPEVR